MLPVVAGLTVWDAVTDDNVFLVAEQPNFFGRIERLASRRPDLSIRWWDSVGKPPPPVIKADRRTGDIDTARRLATALRTIPGVKLPHGSPQAPWFILNLPCRPVAVSRALADSGWPSATPVGDDLPEFPGGLHLEVAWPLRDNHRIAATIRAAVADAE